MKKFRTFLEKKNLFEIMLKPEKEKERQWEIKTETDRKQTSYEFLLYWLHRLSPQPTTKKCKKKVKSEEIRKWFLTNKKIQWWVGLHKGVVSLNVPLTQTYRRREEQETKEKHCNFSSTYFLTTSIWSLPPPLNWLTSL